MLALLLNNGKHFAAVAESFMRFAFICAAIIAFASCNEHKQEAVKELVITDGTAPETPGQSAEKDQATAPTVDTVPFNIQVDTIINLAFAADSSTLTARGSINKGSHVTCYLHVDKKISINATIIPDDNKLNIRFSQIIMPDNSSDGPFSRQLKYDLTKKGIYKILVSPNNMAEGKRNGNFIIRIKRQ